MIDLKRPLPRIHLILTGAIAGVVIASVVFIFTGRSIFSRVPEKPPSPAGMSNAELTAFAFGVLEYLGDNDFEALSRIVHPDFGLVFSPYATVSISANKRFNAEQVASFGTDSNVYIWGVYDGTGEPIEMTPADYLTAFVFSDDYTKASIIGVDRIVKSGNALENITGEFPGLRFIDFHIPGGDKDYHEDLDWSSLRLGFEEHEGDLWLTVIVHSTWTV